MMNKSPVYRSSLRILFVISALNPGGAQRVVSVLANEMARRQIVVGILTIRPGEDAFILDPRVTRIAADTSVTGATVVAPFRRFFRIRNTIRQETKRFHPTCVISFLSILNIRVLNALRRERVPVLVSERNTKEALDGFAWRILRRLSYPLAKGLVVQTQRQAHAFSGHNSNIVVIPNPLELPKPGPFERKEKIILLVGRMSPQKQFDRFLEEIAASDLDGYRIVLAGERREPMASRIDAIISRPDYPHVVELLGHVPDLASLYDTAAIFVLPSRHEGFPNALSEALAWGCSVAGFDCPTGPAELIRDGENGYLIPDQDWNALCASVQYLVKDDTTRYAFYASAISGQKKYGVSEITERWITLCDGISLEGT